LENYLNERLISHFCAFSYIGCFTDVGDKGGLGKQASCGKLKSLSLIVFVDNGEIIIFKVKCKAER
jgi:hypothetical protein